MDQKVALRTDPWRGSLGSGMLVDVDHVKVLR